MVELDVADQLIREECVETLRSALGHGIERARAEGRPILVSAVLPAEPLLTRRAAHGSAAPRLSPLALFGLSRARQDPGFYWERPAECVALAGVGAVRSLAGDSADCLEQVEAAWRGIIAGSIVEDAAARQLGAEEGILLAGPLLLGGAGFDPVRKPFGRWAGFPAARFVVPQYLLAVQGSKCWLTINAMVDPGAQLEDELAAVLHGLNRDVMGFRWEDGPYGGWAAGSSSCAPGIRDGASEGSAAQQYEDLVRLAREAIRRGDAEKIVLARAMTLAGGFSPEGTLAELRRMHPGCTLFAVGEGASCFLGATPERLVCRQGRTVQVDAVAGTARRGVTPEEDARLAAALLASQKDQREHAIVVRMIRDSLEPVCDRISAATEPEIRRLRTVQHLSTPITGELSGESGILSLVERLHPTPAVGGFPREAALRFLRQHEGLDRGWYAGPIGWVSGAGDGDFVVAIRSMLLRRDEATLFAGCGIMADSDPAGEYAESSLKLDSVRCALTQGRGHCSQGEPCSRSRPTGSGSRPTTFGAGAAQERE